MLNTYLQQCPLIAILRGLAPQAAADVAAVLIDAGFAMVEVPLNSPDACQSIQAISARFGHRALIGAGTVTRIEQVEQVAQAGGKIIVSPNCDIRVIERSKKLGLISLPGCCTPSEIYTALDAGADAIKLFPATLIPPAAVAAMRAALPAVPLLAVGGIGSENFADYLRAGVAGFGLGSSLFRPQMSLAEIRENAEHFIRRFGEVKASMPSTNKIIKERL
jgi:2-dehydro-3-deoxyphosphogalactonate aldolase